MTSQLKEKILANISETKAAMLKYDEKTSAILTTDIDETLEQLVSEREDILGQLTALRSELDTLAGECSAEEASYIKNLLIGQHVTLAISPELKEIRKAIVELKSVHHTVQEKDKQAGKRVDARVQELRARLEELNDDKRRLDFYNQQQNVKKKGGSFDSSL